MRDFTFEPPTVDGTECRHLAELENIIDTSDITVLFYKKLLELEYNKSKAGEKDQMQDEMKEKLRNIKEELISLKRRNEDAEDIEKLEVDDFCMDLELKKNIEEEGIKKSEEIRKNSIIKNLEQEV